MKESKIIATARLTLRNYPPIPIPVYISLVRGEEEVEVSDMHLKLETEVEERRKWKHQVRAVEASAELRSDREPHLGVEVHAKS